MLAFFRTNQLLANIFLLPYVVLLHLHLFIYPGKTTLIDYDQGILSSWIIGWIGQNVMWNNIASVLLLFLQAIMINLLVINNRLSREISLFPGLFYILIASSIPSFLPLSPLIIANTFFIACLISLFSVYKKPIVASTILNAGIWIGLASLAYFSYFSLFILGLIGLNILRAFKIRERLMLLSGVFIPFFLLGVYFFWEGQLAFYLNRAFYFRLNWNEFIMGLEDFNYLKIGFFPPMRTSLAETRARNTVI